MAVTPSTNLYLIAKENPITNKHQVTFESAEAQHEYFMSRYSVIGGTDFSYQRQNSTIRYPAHIDTLLIYKYCCYQNENYGDKWFYARITGMKYINDNMTEITIKEDVFQTWMFDYFMSPCFVEREMVDVEDDTYKKNLVDEGLELGDIDVSNTSGRWEAGESGMNLVFVIGYTGDSFMYQGISQYTIDTSVGKAGYYFVIDGQPQSFCYIVCYDAYTYNQIIKSINDEGKGESISVCFTMPYFAISSFNCTAGTYNGDSNTPLPISINCVVYHEGVFNSSNHYGEVHFEKPTTLAKGYTPRNKKLLHYPYSYFACTPTNGTSKIYKYEDFVGDIYFTIHTCVVPNGDLMFSPWNYKNVMENRPESVVVSGFPTLTYTTDTFNMWYAQNSTLNNLKLLSSANSYYGNSSTNTANKYITEIEALQEVSNSLSNVTDIWNLVSNPLGTVLGTTSNLASIGGKTALQKSIYNVNQQVLDNDYEISVQEIMATTQAQSLTPDGVSMGTASSLLLNDQDTSGINIYSGLSLNLFTGMSIKTEYAERIDKYFDMYGYKVNTVKVPNTNNRPNWNYVKTQGCIIRGNQMPNYAISELKEMFDSGVTLWHNWKTMYDYSQDNRTTT